MLKNKILGLLLISCLAIGRFYDSRLQFVFINFAFISSVFFILLLILSWPQELTRKIKKIIIIVLFIIIYNSILWLIYGFNTIYWYSLDKFINLMFLAIVPGIYFSNSERYKVLISGLHVFTFFFLFIGILTLLTKGIDATGRFKILGGGPIVFSRWMSVLLCISLYMKTNKIFRIITVILALFFIYLAGSKGPVLSLILVLVIYLIKKGNFMRLFIFGVIISIVFLTGDFQLDNSRITSGIDNPEELSSVNSRLRKITVAKKLFLENPLGIGLGNYPKYGKKIDPDYILVVDYPHNIFIEIFVELGYIFGIVFILLILYLLVKAYKIFFLTPLSPLFFIFLFNTQFSGDLSNSKFLIIIIIILSLKNEKNLALWSR